MLPEVRTLLDVQEIDKEILELTQQLNRYPVIWEEVKQKLAKRKEGLDRAEKNLDRHQKERRRIEQKLRIMSDDLRRLQTQQNALKTAREYDALNKQSEALKQKMAQLEEQGLDLINKDPATEAAVKDAGVEVTKAEELYKSEKVRIREQFNEKKARVAELEIAKKRVLAAAPPEAITLYERILKRHPGSAIAPVRSGSCAGCHFGLLPNDLVRLHREEKIVTCPNCDRILSEDENYVPAEQASAG